MSDPNSNALANPNAELALLSAASRGGPKALAEIASVVREDWFSSADRALTWRVLHDNLTRGLPSDLTLIEDSLITGGMSEIGAKKMAAALGDTAPTVNIWAPLAQRVENYYTRRKGVEICRAALAQFQDSKLTPAEALEAAEAALFSLHAQKLGKGMRHIGASLNEALASIEESIKNRGHVTGGLASGFTGIDRCNIKGLRPGHMWVVSAPPGYGKTVFLMKLAWNIATASGDYREFDPARHPAAKVGIFTLEMDDVQLAERCLLTQARVELNKMQRGMIARADQDKLEAACQKIRASHLYIEHCPGITVQELRVKCRYAVARHGLQMIGIDYAQLVGSSSRAAQGNRTQTLMDVSMGINLIADECKVPVVVLAQPKQETWGTRAGLNSLGETSQLAKDADLVGMLGPWDPKRLRLKNQDDDEDDEYREPDDPNLPSYFDIVKNRNGPNTDGKPPIKLKWERDFYDMVSTNNRLFDSTGKEMD